MIERLLKDPQIDVRVAAVRALASVRGQSAWSLMRAYARDADPRRLSAAAALADSSDVDDLALAELTMEDVARDPSAPRGSTSRACWSACGVPPHRDRVDVRRRCRRGASRRHGPDGRQRGSLFVPPLISAAAQPHAQAEARDALVTLGPAAVDLLGHVPSDADEDAAVRREIPASSAARPIHAACRRSPPRWPIPMAGSASPRSRRSSAASCGRSRLAAGDVRGRRAQRVEQILAISRFASTSSTKGMATPRRSSRALDEKIARTGAGLPAAGARLPWRDIDAARWAITRGDARARASATEYLDNLLTGALRKRILPIVGTRRSPRRSTRATSFAHAPPDTDESLVQLVHDDDQVIAAAAIQCVEQQQRWQLAGDLKRARTS
jgi:hypothetical protein